MQRPLFLAVGLALAGIRAGYAQAQYTFAGLTPNTSYVSLNPAVVLTGQAGSPSGSDTSQLYEADLDGDGRTDLRLVAFGALQSGYGSHGATVLAKHTDIEFYTTVDRYPVCMSLASGDTLQPVMHRRNAAGVLGTWANGSSIYNGTTYFNPYYLGLTGSGGTGPYSAGYWLDLQEHYVGFRLRASPGAAWRYGWLLAQLISSANPASLSVKSYALASRPLAALPARAGGWQVYPTQATDQLTIELPTSSAEGPVRIIDLCGREVLRAALGSSPQRLRLPGLAAGTYVVQLDTPTGRLTQRIVKQ